MSKAFAEEYNKSLRPITKEQRTWARRNLAKYIFIKDKEGNARCSACERDTKLINTKHLQEGVRCPKCKRELTVQHTWRMKNDLRTVEWMAIPKVINNHVLCLRFVSVRHYKDRDVNIQEEGRMFIDEMKVEPEYYHLEYYGSDKGKFVKGKGWLFSKPSYCCWSDYDKAYYATPYPKHFYDEVGKLDCFKYYPIKDVYDEKRMITQLHYIIRSAKVNEKLIKAGLGCLSERHLMYYINNGDRCYSTDNTKTKLTDILKLNKPLFNILKENCNSYKYGCDSLLTFLQKNKKVNVETIRLFLNTGRGLYAFKGDMQLASELGVTLNKLYHYSQFVVNEYEYKHYISILRYLNYDLKDLSYSMPKDFKKADERVTREYDERLKAEEAKRNAILKMEMREKDEMIKKISDGLRAMPDLQSFLNGSRGFLIHVPESNEELSNEGKALHNCIGTYTNRIAQGDTLVFYLRRLDDPSAPFVAFEYKDGKVLQCRYDHNVTVNDDKIINFVNAFADVLKRNGVLVA